MKKILLIIIVIGIAYLFVPVTVNGSLYIVTNSADVVPMPMSQIKVYSESAFRKALYQKQNYASKYCIGLPDKAEVEKDYLSNGPSTNNAKTKYDLIVSCETRTLLNDIDLAAIEIIQTNKDGEFTLSLSRFDKVILLANGQRDVLVGTETYQWLKSTKLDAGFSNKMEINNMDLVQERDIRTIRF
jgi:hypothetical protein